MERFPRQQRKTGQRIEVLSPFSQNLLDADLRAFVALMKHLKRVDGEENTVIMVQVENELGLLKDSRDRSPRADTLFAEEVPQALTDGLVARKERLIETERDRHR